MVKTKYHTHTTFCDGKNSPEELVEWAIQRDFTDLGFSAHSIFPFSSSMHLAAENHEKYCREIRQLKEKFSHKIRILVGFEAEFLLPDYLPLQSNYSEFQPDFLIGAVHMLSGKSAAALGFQGDFGDGHFSVDGPADHVKEGIQRVFDGDGKLACQVYFASVREMVATCDFDIVAHPDVLRRRNSILRFFHEDASWYKDELEKTARVLSQSGKIIEINTGGIARNCVTTPYPSPEFLRLIHEGGGKICINSDCHRMEYLDAAYDVAIKTAETAGFKSIMVLSAENHWKEIDIKDFGCQ
jgi:histidinol-phosphatase (PHP family)